MSAGGGKKSRDGHASMLPAYRPPRRFAAPRQRSAGTERELKRKTGVETGTSPTQGVSWSLQNQQEAKGSPLPLRQPNALPLSPFVAAAMETTLRGVARARPTRIEPAERPRLEGRLVRGHSPDHAAGRDALPAGEAADEDSPSTTFARMVVAIAMNAATLPGGVRGFGKTSVSSFLSFNHVMGHFPPSPGSPPSRV